MASEGSRGAKITFLRLQRCRKGQKSLFCGFGGVARGKNHFSVASEGSRNSLRDYFDVYAVTAVSLNEEFGRGYETALGCALEGGSSTGISGDEEAVFSYVKCVEGVDEEDVLAVVILNTPTYAGTTYYGYCRREWRSARSLIVRWLAAWIMSCLGKCSSMRPLGMASEN